MALKTYLPKLLRLLRVICVYIGRYREKINHFVGEDNVGKVDDVLVACEALTAVLEVIIPDGD